MSYLFRSPCSAPQERSDAMLAWVKAHCAMLAWAKAHCASYITNMAIQGADGYHYHWYFGDEQDLLIFALKWS